MTKKVNRPDVSWGWRSMWVIAMFDLPTETDKAKKEYVRFRKALLDDGFVMMQYSIYMRHCANMENAAIHARRMGSIVPPRGEVRFMTLTDKQFEKMEVFIGKSRQEKRISPSQLDLF